MEGAYRTYFSGTAMPSGMAFYFSKRSRFYGTQDRRHFHHRIGQGVCGAAEPHSAPLRRIHYRQNGDPLPPPAGKHHLHRRRRPYGHH